MTTRTAADPSARAVTDLTVIPCKCCSGPATLYGAVDFSRTCEDRHAPVFGSSGVDIPYHRCAQCGFIFTIAFDDLGPEQFRQYIYNGEYALVDPDFTEARPLHNAALLHKAFGHAAARLRVLDYGGGNGLLTTRLRELGFAHAETYDPFYEGSTRPTGTFDLVTAFEVLEHTPAPRATLAEMASFMSAEGMIFCSTLLQPEDIDRQRLRWWYAAPRNGHVSLYSREALGALAGEQGFTWGSADGLLHAMWRGALPRFAQGLLR